MPDPNVPTRPPGSSPAGRLGRLLIVDDEVELKNALCDMLPEHGYDVVGFTSGQEAVQALSHEDFDLLLADLMMPEMDGITLLRAGLEIDPNLVGIIMTGQGTVQTAVEAMKIGALDYVLKPFKLQALLPTLSRAMQVRRLRLENVQLRETVGIYELSMAIAFTMDTATILSKIADAALQQCQADEVSVMLPTPDGDALYVAVVRGDRPRPILGERMPMNRGVAGWVAREQQPLTLRGLVTDPRFAPVIPRADICAAISMPMLVGGTLVGVLSLNATDRRRSFRLGQVKALSILASIAASALENARLYKEVREAEGKYRSLFENAVEGIFHTTPEGQFVAANPALARSYGYDSPEELIAAVKDISRQVYVDPDRRAEIMRLLQERNAVFGLESQVYRKDGRVIWVSENAHALYDSQGKLRGYEGMVVDITARKQAEELLRLQGAALDAAANAIVITDREGLVTWVNPAFTRLTGYTPEETVGQNLRLLKSGIHDRAFYQDLWETILSGQAWHREMINRRKDGTLYADEQTITPVRDERGEITHFITIKRDITERKRDEEIRRAIYLASLQVQETTGLQEQLDYLLQTARDVLHFDRVNVLLADREGRWLEAVAGTGIEEPLEALRVPIGPEGGSLAKAYLSRQAVGWNGQGPVPEEMRLLPPYDRIAAFRSRIFVSLPLVVQGQGIGVLGVDRKHSRRPIESAVLEILHLFGTQVALAVEHARVHAALQAEVEEQTRRTRELAALNKIGTAASSSLALSDVLDHALDATLAILGMEGGEIFLLEEATGEVVLARHRGDVSGAFSEISRFKLGEGIVGQVAASGEALVVTDLASDQRFLRKQVVRNGFRVFASFPLKAKGKVVGTLNVAARGPRVFSQADLNLVTTIGSTVGMAVVNAQLYEELRVAALQLEAKVEDRTRELHAANGQLQAAMGQVEAASCHKSEFLANMSHELRTPLNSILGFSELLLEQTKDLVSAKQTRFLTNIYTSGQHLLRLISDILDLSKVEAGKIVLQPEALRVETAIGEIVATARGLSNTRAQTIEIEIEPGLPPLQVDPVRFKQICFNLLSNAVKFTPDGGIITVTARQVTEDRRPETDPVPRPPSPVPCLEIRVTDTGAGIRAEDLPRLFQEFVQLETTQAQRHEGSGLGLALTKRLVELHGGRIWATSDGEGRGSTFAVLLPFEGPGT